MNQRRLPAAALLVQITATTLALLLNVAAEEPAALSTIATGDTTSTYDDIWSLATLYDDESGPIIQKLAFTGRAQFDYTYTKGRQGQIDAWFVRRLRVGIKATLFDDFTLHSEADFDPQAPGTAYQRLTDTYLGWSRDPGFVFKIGKHAAQFTLDGHTSSKKLIAVDRNNLTNNLWYTGEYFPGVSGSGKIDKWHYFAGIFSSGSASPEFGDFDGSNFGLLTLGYDFSECLDVEEALLNVDYVYNKPDTANTFTRMLRHVGSVNFFYDTGKWGLRTDLSAGDGYLGQDDIYGLVVMPFYDLTEKAQLVGRYTHISGGDGMNGVRLSRYENRATAGRGDDYDELYLGVNYYFYDHKLKWQTGVTYAMMDDDAGNGASGSGAWDGWGLTTGLRISW